jgi:hypothetical protein
MLRNAGQVQTGQAGHGARLEQADSCARGPDPDASVGILPTIA